MAVTLKKSVTKTAIYARCRVRFVTRNFCDSKFAPERAERAGSTNRADRTYDRTATNVVYTLLAATITEQ